MPTPNLRSARSTRLQLLSLSPILNTLNFISPQAELIDDFSVDALNRLFVWSGWARLLGLPARLYHDIVPDIGVMPEDTNPAAITEAGKGRVPGPHSIVLLTLYRLQKPCKMHLPLRIFIEIRRKKHIKVEDLFSYSILELTL